jgi:hypothetical protein
MSPDTAVLAEKVAAVERHLRRVVDLLADGLLDIDRFGHRNPPWLG